MTIGSICQREVDLVEADETVRAAAQRMTSRNVGTLVAIDAGSRPVGILTDRDLALRVVGAGLAPHQVLVREIMTPDPEQIDEEAPVESGLTRMRSSGIRRLVVTDAGGHLAGILSLDDVLDHLAREMGEVRRLMRSSSPENLSRV